jgi:hypothetical protein
MLLVTLASANEPFSLLSESLVPSCAIDTAGSFDRVVKRYPLAQAVDFITVIPEARRRIPQQPRRGPWLDVFCPGCGTSRAIDLRTGSSLASSSKAVLNRR